MEEFLDSSNHVDWVEHGIVITKKNDRHGSGKKVKKAETWASFPTS